MGNRLGAGGSRLVEVVGSLLEAVDSLLEVAGSLAEEDSLGEAHWRPRDKVEVVRPS